MQEVRRKLFARVRHSVCSKLFLAKPTFCQHLVEINQFVSDISQVKMSYCNSSHLYQLEEYSDLQVVTREQKAKPAIESTSEKVQQVILPSESMSSILRSGNSVTQLHCAHVPRKPICLCKTSASTLHLPDVRHQSMPNLPVTLQIVERVCKEAQKQARIYQESIRDMAELEDTTGVELFQGRDSGKARSMMAIKAEKIQRAK